MKTIKKKYIIEVEYANEWQKEMHDVPLNIMLSAWGDGMLGTNPMQIPQAKNKNNKFTITVE